MEIDNVTLSEHRKKYMPDLPANFLTDKSPVQVLPLEKVKSYLKFPTPLFKPQYNIILHIAKGKINAQVGLNVIKAEESSVLLMLSNKIISRKYLSGDLEGHCIIVKDEYLVKLLNRPYLLKLLESHPVIPLDPDSSRIIASLNNLLAEELERENCNSGFVTATLQALLLKLPEQSDGKGTISKREEVAFGFKQLLYKHYKEQHSIRFYAGELNISENYLARCTKMTFRKSPKKLWTEVIIQQGQLLLHDHTKEISEIAYGLNFTDPSYFGRLFRQVTNETPSTYRQSIMHDLSGY